MGLSSSTPPRLVQRVSARAEDLSAVGAPTEWQRQAVRRLAFVAAMALGVVLLSLLASLFRQENVNLRVGLQRPVWPIYVGIVCSAAMLLVARSERLSTQRRLDCGLVFLVVICFLMAYFRHAMPYLPSDLVRGVSAVAFGIVFFAILVPVSPKRMAVGSIVAALMDPLALGVTVAQGYPDPPWNLWLWLFLPNVVAVVLAVVSAHLLYQVGRTVTEARQMGAYRLVERLGVGGMGEVWRAEHRTLARPAAIKLVRPEALGAADPKSREQILRRFEREAQATAMLTSPHTIDVFDFGISKDGSFYYVMELLQGMNLDELLRSAGPLPAPRAVYLLEQICLSLRDAHHAGMVHRDIKPANICVCRRGLECDYVKVLDFGLVKRLDSEATQLTVAGGIAGTPAYMAPEAARGREVGPAADLYALGAVAYRMLSGRDLFPGKSTLELIFAQAEEAPPPLAELVDADVPASLSALVMRCLAKDPKDRPASADALLQALRETGLSAGWTGADARAWWEQREAGPQVDDAGSASTLMVSDSGDASADTLALDGQTPLA